MAKRARDDDGLMWIGNAAVESWHDARYWYDSRVRQGQAHVVLQMTLQGGAFHENQAHGRQLVLPGQAFLNHIPGPFNYGYAPEIGGTYKLIFLGLAGQQAHHWCNTITRQFGHVLDIGLHSPIHTMMTAMVHQRQSSKSPADRYITSGRIYQLYMAILSHLTQSRLGQTPRLGDAVSMIHQHAADGSFNVAQLARQLGWSREYLARQFQRVLGVSPSAAITRCRLEHACSLLRQTDDKLENIAAATGLGSATYLCRIFRQHYGVTPAQYRKQPQMVLARRPEVVPR